MVLGNARVNDSLVMIISQQYQHSLGNLGIYFALLLFCWLLRDLAHLHPFAPNIGAVFTKNKHGQSLDSGLGRNLYPGKDESRITQVGVLRIWLMVSTPLENTSQSTNNPFSH